MFLCKDCKKKYRTKPNYCDCGNDTFDEINKLPDWSVFFLITCIILSFVILLIPVKIDSSKTVEKNEPKTVISTTKIPDINTFWNDKPAVAHPKISAPQKQTVVRSTVTQPAKNTDRFIKKETKKIKKQPQISARTNAPPTPKNKAQVQPKPQPKVNTKVKAVSPQKPTPKAKSVQKSKTTTPKKSNISAKHSEELYRYKIGLRQALFANLSVVSIQGEGKCGIEFFIDKTGKLINRAFTFQSDNGSVNDEVYKMLMKMPKYYAPPEAYNGEKIKMIFEFDNGSYIINYS